MVCGYLSHADKRTHLNPPDSQVLSRGDKLIVLSHKALPDLAPGGSTAAGLDVEALRQRLEAAQPPPSQPKSIVVVGWTGPTADLVVRRAAWQCGRMRGSARHAGRQPASAGVACAGMWCAQNDA